MTLLRVVGRAAGCVWAGQLDVCGMNVDGKVEGHSQVDLENRPN